MQGSKKLSDFGSRYTDAWCSHDPRRVAAFFSPDGSLTINGGPASVGPDAISKAARSFMEAFPDLKVTMDRLEEYGDRVEYHWTLTGTHVGGNRVQISGFETWQFGDDGLIKDSQGSFDSVEYDRQVRCGL